MDGSPSWNEILRIDFVNGGPRVIFIRGPPFSSLVIPGKQFCWVLKGDRIHAEEFSDYQSQEISLAGRVVGIYMVRVISDGFSGTARVMKK
jgi:hypothetical protein